MQWAMPSTVWKAPGKSCTRVGKPNRLITPSTSTKRTGLLVRVVTEVELFRYVGM